MSRNAELSATTIELEEEFRSDGTVRTKKTERQVLLKTAGAPPDVTSQEEHAFFALLKIVGNKGE